ncbi:UNVERIFIED_CONTAM: hypothetical protein FKN15_038668 [Acipenser sinensis]
MEEVRQNSTSVMNEKQDILIHDEPFLNRSHSPAATYKKGLFLSAQDDLCLMNQHPSGLNKMDNCSCRSEYELCADRPRDAGSNLYAEKAPVTECVDRYYLYKLVNSRAAGMRCSGLQKGRTIRMDKTDCVFSSRVTTGSTGAGSRGRWGAFIIDNEDSSDLNVLSGGTCQYQAKAGDGDMDCKASYCYQRSGQIKRRLNLASKETTGDQSADKNTAKEFGQPAHRSFSVQNRRRKFTLSVWSWWAFLVFHTHVLKAAAQDTPTGGVETAPSYFDFLSVQTLFEQNRWEE